MTQYVLTPSKAISGKNLSAIEFDVTLDEDLLEVTNVSVPIGLLLNDTKTPLGKGVIRHHIKIEGNDIALDPSAAIAQFSLFTYVTDTIATPITLTNVKLNGFDPDYERCVLSASGQDTTFTLALLCGDRTLMDFLRTGKTPLAITSIRPNPAHDEVRIDYETRSDEAVTVEIYDALGKLVWRESPPSGGAGVTMQRVVTRTLVLPVGDLPGGAYIARIAQSGEVVSRRFVVER